MTATVSPLHDLLRALEQPRHPGAALGTWRWQVRKRMAPVRDLLLREPYGESDGWLAARDVRSARERDLLLARLHRLGREVLESEDVGAVRERVRRLLTDIEHHRQRLHDLAYDRVELEIGGSE